MSATENINKGNYRDLEKDIKELKLFADPLEEEVIISPITSVISRITLLPNYLDDLPQESIDKIEREVAECKRILESISYNYVKSILAKPKEGRVFKILNNANIFKHELKKSIGKQVEIDGEKFEVTPKFAEALTRYRFSLGTPPVTPEAIETIERILFSDSLQSIYTFRDLLFQDQSGRDTFDRFLSQVDTLVVQSTHYTTAEEKKLAEREATDNVGMEGARGLKKTVVSGTSKTAIRLISDHLLSQHSNGTRPIHVVHELNRLDDDLIEEMKAAKEKMFVVRVTKISHDTLTSTKFQAKWKGVIGRLIIVEESSKSERSASTFVYSINPLFKDTLEKFHVKDSGMPANTEINLRRIMETMSSKDLNLLEDKVTAKINELEQEGFSSTPISQAKKQEWVLRGQKDLLSLRRFLEFIQFIKKIANCSQEEFDAMTAGMMKENEELTMKYFFGALKDKGYDCISVPQGGGRKELGLIGKFHKKKTGEKVEEFRGSSLGVIKENLKRFKNSAGITSTDAEMNALSRALAERGGEGQELRNVSGNVGTFTSAILNRVKNLLQQGTSISVNGTRRLSAELESLVGLNLPGELRALVQQQLDQAGIGSGGKLMEMGKLRETGNLFRGFAGRIGRGSLSVVETLEDGARKLKVALSPRSFELVEKMMNDIEANGFGPRMALPKIAWTFSDVMNEDDYDPDATIKINLDKNGELDLDEFESRLNAIEEQLYLFPDLFDLYCSTILLVVNDPHNPTSKVASNQTKLKLLDIASRFGLTICSDEAYRKQVSKDKKTKQGDGSLSEFYEQNKSRFPNPITIHTSMPVTKWATAGGQRIGSIVTNDSSREMRGFVESNIDGVNIMSLYMNNNTLKTGDLAKVVCKLLYTSTLGVDPEKIIDEILNGYFGDLNHKNFNAPIYFALIEARNKLDLLKTRTETPVGYTIERSKFISKFISNLKKLRLDKVTQKDVAERTKVAVSAVEDLDKTDYPGLKNRTIMPEGPFYMCVKLDETGNDLALSGFLEEIAKSMKIEVVAQPDGYVRLSFGGMVDGSPKGYEILQLAIKTELKILLKYWSKYTELRQTLTNDKVINPGTKALRKLFQLGERGIALAIREKAELINAMGEYEEKKRSALTFNHSANVDGYISRIQPDSPAHIVTIRGVTCKNAEEFINSKPFKDLFNHYLIEVKDKIPELGHLKPNQIIRKYGADQFANQYDSRSPKNNQRDVFARIVIEIANLWFNHDTIKILAGNGNGMELKGTEATLSSFIKEFIDSFVPEEMQDAIHTKPTFQVGYSSVDKVTMASGAPKWMQGMIEKDGAEFIIETSATDRSPEMKTGAETRVPGHDRQIFRRDGDGINAPKKEYFSNRLEKFAENMNSKDYAFKMIQIGGSSVLTVIHRAYSHYLAEEMRLFPQFEVKPEDLKNIKPDCISFLGIPSKVMGEDYRIGYFMDEYEDGTSIPVSWVDRENITDYMGYLKKPILTVANEKMKEKEIMPVHGGAFTVVFKNGLRKTIVMGGDSGTGKSETLIAMVEQIMKGIGVADEVESVELLAGDMLAMFEGDDGEMYMLGTEQGDFMRMTDISENWKARRNDLVGTGSKTNLDSETNPRITVADICKPSKFLVPVRVNMFLNINNYQKPPGQSAMRETKNPANLMMEYVRGYRGEKGTSGDQPNIHGSMENTMGEGMAELLGKYKETFDDLLGWNISMNKIGKAENAVLRFKDVDGGVHEAKKMVRDLFIGKIIDNATITATRLDPQSGEFYVTIKDVNGQTQESKLYRKQIFAKIFNSTASTYCGNPFVDPRGMDIITSRFADVMTKAGVITGTLYTQLKLQGMEFEGPEKAAQGLIDFIIRDTRITQRFQKHKKAVNEALLTSYGDAIIPSGTVPLEIEKHNLWLYEKQTSVKANPVNSKGKSIPLKTPHYESDTTAQRTKDGSEEEKPKFNPSITTEAVRSKINYICQNEDNQAINLDSFEFDVKDYSKIIKWDCIEELIYQILILNGIIDLGSDPSFLHEHQHEVMKAQKIAEAMIRAR